MTTGYGNEGYGQLGRGFNDPVHGTTHTGGEENNMEGHFDDQGNYIPPPDNSVYRTGKPFKRF